MKYQSKRYCRNCHYPLPYKAKYCAHCGQRDTDGRVTMLSLLRRLWSTTFHLEGKFIRAAWQLFIPAKVTLAFFKGKIERYPHPLRFFAIIMFLFLLAINTTLKNAQASNEPVAEFGTGQPGSTTSQYSADDMPGVGASEDGSVNFSLSTEGDGLYKAGQHYALLHELRSYYDALPPSLHTPESHQAFDSVLERSRAVRHLSGEGLFTDVDSSGKTTSLDTIPMSLGFRKVKIAVTDVFQYEPDELIRRYQLTNWLDRLVVRQGIKTLRDPNGLIHAYIGSLTWTILALIAVMAAILGLLYWRQHRYYVEHFIFLLHYHAAILLAFTLLMLINLAVPVQKGWWTIATLWPIPALYVAMLRFYGQGWFKTLVKLMLFGSTYLMGFILLFVGGMLVVAAVF